MILDLGVVKPGSKLWIPVNTFDSNDPAASVTATNWANTDVHIHKDGAVAQRTSSAGETLSLNFDGITGGHVLEVDLADNTHAGFYAAGSRYIARIEGVTVDAGTVNAFIAMWTIGYPGSILDATIVSKTSATQFIITEGPAEADILIGCPIIIHDVASKLQMSIGYIVDYIVTTKEVFLDADPGGFTFVATDNVSIMLPSNVRAIAGSATAADNVNSAADNYSATRGLSGTALPAVAAEGAGGLFTRGTGAGQVNQDANGRLDANVAATDDIDLSATQKTSVNTEVDNALDTAVPGSPTANSINARVVDIETATEITLDTVVDSNSTDLGTLLGRLTAGRATLLDNLDAAITSLNDLSAADVNGEMVDVMTVDTIPELTVQPGTNPTFAKAMMLQYMDMRNEGVTAATLHEVKNNAGTVIAKSTLSEAASVFTHAKMVNGP